MSEELKPCPACGGVARRMIRDTGPQNAYRKWVECTACPCRTSVHLTEDVDAHPADDEWNALPRALVWTTTPPAKPGFYWWRSGQGKNVYLYNIVRSDSSNELFRENANGSWCSLLRYGEWAGPIPTPQEQKS